jgi:hypothetical protein
MRGRARLDVDQAGWQSGKEPGHLGPLELPSNHDLPRGVNAVDLRHAFGKIETNGVVSQFDFPIL